MTYLCCPGHQSSPQTIQTDTLDSNSDFPQCCSVCERYWFGRDIIQHMIELHDNIQKVHIFHPECTATDVNLTRALWDTVSTDVSHANFPCCTDCQPPPFTPPNDFPSQMHDNGQWHSNHAWHLCGKHHIKPCEQTTVSPQLSLCQMCMFMASVLSHLYQWGRENCPRKSRNYCRWNSQYHQ